MVKVYLSPDAPFPISDISCVHYNNLNGVTQLRIYAKNYWADGTFRNYALYLYRYDDMINDYFLEFSSYNTSLPSGTTCDNTSLYQFTNNVFYRKDITDILICFFILSIVCIYLPYKIFSRMFGRWLKL